MTHLVKVEAFVPEIDHLRPAIVQGYVAVNKSNVLVTVVASVKVLDWMNLFLPRRELRGIRRLRYLFAMSTLFVLQSVSVCQVACVIFCVFSFGKGFFV